ncbi:MAG: hypothetical protein ACE5JQ_03465 [Candidatus Methylomirabilales bacterium]
MILKPATRLLAALVIVAVTLVGARRAAAQPTAGSTTFTATLAVIAIAVAPATIDFGPRPAGTGFTSGTVAPAPPPITVTNNSNVTVSLNIQATNAVQTPAPAPPAAPNVWNLVGGPGVVPPPAPATDQFVWGFSSTPVIGTFFLLAGPGAGIAPGSPPTNFGPTGTLPFLANLAPTLPVTINYFTQMPSSSTADAVHDFFVRINALVGP